MQPCDSHSVKAIALYSGSVVDLAIKFCFFIFQLICECPNSRQKSEVDLRDTGQLAQSLIEYACKEAAEDMAMRMPWPGLPTTSTCVFSCLHMCTCWLVHQSSSNDGGYNCWLNGSGKTLGKIC